MQRDEKQWRPYLQRYTQGEWRAPIFRDMILADVMKLEKKKGKLSLLDIGCGRGFDNDAALQRSLSQVSGEYIGVEPNSEIELGNIFSRTFRCLFEDAEIEPDSIDIAFAVMVLEHFEKPQLFWDKVHRVLKDGGVFWGFTVDARHWFVFASLVAERLHIKDWYLDRLHGKRGEDRYENYGVFYKSNAPHQIEGLTTSFRSRIVLNFNRVGQMDYYFPEKLRWIGRSFDRAAISLGRPGSIMAVRVQK